MNWGHLAATAFFLAVAWVGWKVARAAFLHRREYLAGRAAYRSGRAYGYRWNMAKQNGWLDAEAMSPKTVWPEAP